jgi:hypothetical protein
MYYPKSKITENLKTDGNGFLIKETLQSYKGYYYSTFDGKYFAGASPTIGNKELITTTKTKAKEQTNPQTHSPAPTPEDYQKGYVTRYVCKRVNSGINTIMEITKENSEQLKNNPLYATTSFNWKISGELNTDLSNPNNPIYGAVDVNRKTLHDQEKKIPGISLVFINLAQYFR